MIRIEGLSYSYPNSDRPALDDISFSVSTGEFVLLAGPSGSGKSTLLRCLNGLVPHFSGGTVSGQIEVHGHDPIRHGPAVMSQSVGFVFQDPEAQMVLDLVEEEIAFGLENAGISREVMHARVEEALSIMGIESFRDRSISTLSGGERQQVAIASALVTRPKILALDEPTSQLDPQSARDVLEAISRLNKEFGLTIFLVEHRLERVVAFTGRLLYLEEGRLVVDEPIRQGLSSIRKAKRPPLGRLAEALNWDQMPLAVEERDLFTGLAKEHGLRSPSSGITVNSVYTNVIENEKPRLVVRDVHYAYTKSVALRGVDFDLTPGEAVALLGRNGAGKSTLLRCIVGLLRPAQGEITLDGLSLLNQPVAQICRQIAYLPQTPDDLLFSDTVLAELEVTLRNHGLASSSQEMAPDELLHQMGLGGLAQAYPRDLSVGQRQRVALGAIMITEPGILILDEPTRGLDYESKSRLMSLWRRWQQAGLGLLLVTHDVELAARVSNRVLILEEGRIATSGPTNVVLGESTIFSPQVARLFPESGWLTVDDVLEAGRDFTPVRSVLLPDE